MYIKLQSGCLNKVSLLTASFSAMMFGNWQMSPKHLDRSLFDSLFEVMLLLHGAASVHPGLQRKFRKEMPLMSLGVHGKFSCLASWEVGLIEQLTGSTSKRCF